MSNWRILRTIDNNWNSFLFLDISRNQCSRLPTDPATSQHIMCRVTNLQLSTIFPWIACLSWGKSSYFWALYRNLNILLRTSEYPLWLQLYSGYFFLFQRQDLKYFPQCPQYNWRELITDDYSLKIILCVSHNLQHNLVD